MTTFVPPQLIRTTGDLTVEKVIISPLTGVATALDLNTDKSTGSIAEVSFIGHDDATNDTVYARAIVTIDDPTNTSEDGSLALQTVQAGSLGTRATLAAGLTMAGATGGDQGAGTINATNMYVNGVAVGTGSGDVAGPGSATDNAVARFDTTTGKLIQNSPVIIGDTGNVTGVNDLTVTGDLTVNGTTTTVNTTNLAVEDSLIQLARLNSATDTLDIGFVGLYDTSGSQDLYAGIFRDATDGKFHAFNSSQEDLSATNVVNKAATGYTIATIVATLEGNVTGQVSDLSNHDTDDLSEGTTNKYASSTNVNAAGAVMETDFNAQTVLVAVTDDTPVATTVADSQFVGRPAGGNVGVMTKAQALTVLNVEDGADVTDAANVNSAGAVMETDFDAQTILMAVADDTPLPVTFAASTFAGRKATGDVGSMTVAEALTVLGVTAGAEPNLTWSQAVRVTVTDYTEGVSTALTLPSNPGGIEANVRVSFNGITQHNTEWSLSGTTITFTSAIPVGVTAVELSSLA